MLAELVGATVLLTLPLAESSGLAVAGDRVYAVEDSGGPSTVFAFDRSGALVDEIAVDAENVDWEDLAVADGALFVGDTGDNRSRRDHVAVHRVPLGGGPTTTYRLTYADGPRDAESLVVRDGQVAVVSKELLGAGLYVAPLRDGAVLERVADVPVAVATGASWSPDGTRFAVRDYTGVSEWVVDGDLARAVAADPVRSDLPVVEQGEAIAYDGGPDAVLVSTEGAGGPVHRLVRAAAASGAATPPAPAAGASAAPAAAPAEDGVRVLPLAVALGAVLGALALVALRRR